LTDLTILENTPYLREEVSEPNTDSMASQSTLADLMAKLEALAHDMAQTRADLHETKEQVKKYLVESPPLLEKIHPHRETTVVITLITHPIPMINI